MKKDLNEELFDEEVEEHMNGEDSDFTNIPNAKEYDYIRIPSAFIRSKLLKASEMRLYLAICILRDCGDIYPSINYLSEKVGWGSSDKVISKLKKLADCGLLQKKQRRKKDGSWTSNSYELVNLKDWVIKREGKSDSVTFVKRQIILNSELSDVETRLYMVIKSLSSRNSIKSSIKKLYDLCNCSKKNLLYARKSLVEKKLLSYENKRRRIGMDENEYFLADEDEWLKSREN